MTPLSTPSHSPSGSDIAALRLDVDGIPYTTTVDESAELFLRAEHARMLCLPVVDEDGRALGTVSRHTLNGIFLRRFGRELLGHKPVTHIMNPQPLRVALDSSLEAAAAYVTAQLGSPITEDFIIEDGTGYKGMGVVLDLLSALQQRVVRDASQLGEAYAQLQASQAQLVQSEKMASLGQMVAGVAHEINTPLGYVRNNVEMVRELFGQAVEALDAHQTLFDMLTNAEADEAGITRQLSVCQSAMETVGGMAALEDARALCNDTLFGVDTIRDLVVNLRNFSRLDQARVAEISINDCLDQTLAIARTTIGDRVQVIKRYGELPAIACSPSQINQVLLNMMVNAAQAIEHDKGRLLLRTEADAQGVSIHIQDNGKGIPPDQLQRIFDPFFTTKPVGQGTGLGLSICYRIVQAHGGSIHVVSEIGRGTKFVIRLPLRAPAPAAEAAPPADIAREAAA